MINEEVQNLSDMGIEKLEVVDQCLSLAPSGTFLEIGTRRGGTALLATMHDNCEYLICVDPYKAFPDKAGNLIEMNLFWFVEAYDALMKSSKPFFFFKGTSKEFMDEPSGTEFAYVLLDGEHTNEAVQMEIDYFSKRMIKGGILLVDNVDWLTLDFTGWEKPRFDMAYKIF